MSKKIEQELLGEGYDFSALSPEEQARLMELLGEETFRKAHNQIEDYSPYFWQEEFHAAGAKNPQRLLMAGNRTGKTFCGAAEMAYHLTGRYPDNWEGRRWDRPIKGWACGVSNAKTRDIVQSELLGDCDDPDALGTGAIPWDCIVKTTRAPNIPNGIQSVIIKHYDKYGKFDGHSKLQFLSYEMGKAKFMGDSVDYIWLDEEPEYDIFSSCITRTADRAGAVAMTFTPETGMTTVVKMFMHDKKPGMHMTRAGWDDCPHLTEEVKNQLLAVYLPHEREMRRRGDPVFGSGLVFPVAEAQISCEPFEIPPNWPRIAGLDFGWDHPTAAAWITIDPESGTIYLYDTYRERKAVVAVHASAIKARGIGIPIIWPHDGYVAEKGSGQCIADQYRNEGVNMLPMHFTNPPAPGLVEGSGGMAVEPGIMHMLTLMETGRFKVFSHLRDWFKEFGMYHRKEGKIIKLDDDLMSATRYAVMSTRFAEIQGGAQGWSFGGKIDYPEYGAV